MYGAVWELMTGTQLLAAAQKTHRHLKFPANPLSRNTLRPGATPPSPFRLILGATLEAAHLRIRWILDPN